MLTKHPNIVIPPDLPWEGDPPRRPLYPDSLIRPPVLTHTPVTSASGKSRSTGLGITAAQGRAIGSAGARRQLRPCGHPVANRNKVQGKTPKRTTNGN
jgi:hypothetical protein